MKCALIIPAWVPEEIFSGKTAGSQINYWQPLGTLYVASSLQRAGHEVKFFNGAFMTNAQIIAAVGEFAPAVIGLYSTTFGWPKAQKTARDLGKQMPGSFIVVGGPYPIAVQEKCLEECADIDAVVTGEGELTMVEMLARLKDQQSLQGVEGVVYREQGIIKKNPPRPLIMDLDSLPPPARELLGEAGRYIPPPATYKRRPVAVLITSRGCNRRCLYCFQIDRTRKSGIRYRSVDNVLAEIELILGQGYKEIKFIDDTLAADYDRAMEIARRIKEQGLDFTWFASACVNQVDKPLLRAFKDAGCWAVLFGAESGVQKDLNTIRKGITPAQIKRAVKAAKEVGLTVYTPFLFGIPGQTFADGLKSIEFACELDPDIANFHALTPFPGTDLYDNIEKYGTMSEDLSDYSYQGAAFVPYSMTRDEIAQLRQIAFKKFYSRPGFLLRRLFKLRTIHDLQAAIHGIKSMFWLWIRRGVFKR
ncbi:MAG: B12-binding domain-containing radical SAM protein [Desulfobacterales bacterium]|nr:B12-binding domain-containing radical SAM protein [Desulfobacterales bacterium]